MSILCCMLFYFSSLAQSATKGLKQYCTPMTPCPSLLLPFTGAVINQVCETATHTQRPLSSSKCVHTHMSNTYTHLPLTNTTQILSSSNGSNYLRFLNSLLNYCSENDSAVYLLFSFPRTHLFICLSHTKRHAHSSSSQIRLNSSVASGNSLIVLQRSFDWWVAFASQTFLLGTTPLQVCVSLETKDPIVNMRQGFYFLGGVALSGQGRVMTGIVIAT